jgi:hypothetical protein
MKKLALLSDNKFPEFIREEYPNLIAFVKAYYRFLEQSKTVGEVSELDTTSIDYLRLYKNTVARGFSDPKNMSVRDFISSNKEFFSRKGTADAFKFFFKAYFGDNVDVIKPDYIVASGAEATGDFFFYVKTISGALVEHDPIVVSTQAEISIGGGITTSKLSKNVSCTREVFKPSFVGYSIFINSTFVGIIDVVTDGANVVLTNNARVDAEGLAFHLASGYSKNKINVVRTEQLDANTTAIYFIPQVGYSAQIGDKVTVTKNNAITFVGSIKATPYRIVPLTPGSGWRLGQVIQFPSNVSGGSSTIARVTKISETSGLEALEIIQYGYPMSAEQYSISSFRSIADNSSNSTAFEQEQQDDGHYEQALSIYDNTVDSGDSIVVSLVDISSPDAYFGEDYYLEDFHGTLQAYAPFRDPVQESQTQDPEEIAESYATMRVLTGALAKEKTKYYSDASIISNQNSRVHDSLYYQAFAYKIQTEVDISEYRGSLDLIHPAGTKFSALLVKKFEVLNTDVAIIESHTFPNPHGVSANVMLGNMVVNKSSPLVGKVAYVGTSNLGYTV